MQSTAIIRNNIHYVTNTQGDKLAIQFDLKNKLVRDFIEDCLDMLDVIDRENEPSKPFEEVYKEILIGKQEVNA